MGISNGLINIINLTYLSLESIEMSRKKIAVVILILIISIGISLIAGWKGANVSETLLIGISSALLGCLLEFRFSKISELIGESFLDHYKTIEKRILESLRLAVGSESLSIAIHDNIVEPTVSTFISSGLISNDKFAEALYINTLHDLGDKIRNSYDKGLPVTRYLTALHELSKHAETIQATSLLPPSLWFKNPEVQNYLNLQTELLGNKYLKTCKRIFLIPEKFFVDDDWNKIKSAHGIIEVKKVVKDSIAKELFMDFVIFDQRGVLVSQTLRELIISNDIRDCAELERRYKTCAPYINAYYIFAPAVVSQYIEKLKELSFMASV